MSRQWMKSVLLTLAAGGLFTLPAATNAQTCANVITADVVALDQVFHLNRRGACLPHGQMFALARDVVDLSSGQTCDQVGCGAGKVELRPDKRPRPLVLRMNAGDCLQVNFKNLINPIRSDVHKCPDCIDPVTGNLGNADEQPLTRHAGFHAIGMQLVGGITSDGSNVGKNASSLVPPNGTAQYTLYAEREGQHLLYSTAANTGGEGNGGQLPMGLFGSVNVEPRGAKWYRSQVSEADMALATTGTTALGQPLLNFEKINPTTGLPVFNMLCPFGATGCTANEIVHSDLTAIIRGPFDESYPDNKFTYPARDQSFREFTIIYHDELGAVQAFKQFDDPNLSFSLHSVRDAFAINYGSGGVGAEILANRLGLGPEANCTGCKYEEFFLSAWVVGDPAMVVDNPANSGTKATEAFFPDDPSNVYHSYLRDHTKMRILHAGPKEHHVHHLHAHQWLFTPDSDESAYLDSQAIGPGASFTLEMTYNGSGNRNQTVGDSIFHCHFYPHFAQGMWAMWRVHDVFEDGSRNLPDAEILAGTPSPAVVPIPELPMAPSPGATVTIVNGQVHINGVKALDWVPNPSIRLAKQNPGYPYFIPGLAGARPPHPPLDTIDDGGLPRHMLKPGGSTISVETRFDFTKEVLSAEGIALDENGIGVEQAAMAYHGSSREWRTYNTNGVLDKFTVNGLPPSPGAPYAEPCITDTGLATGTPRTYKAADIQLDVIFNKKGWHFPQQRMLALWDDVWPTFNGQRPPEPFFFRANSGDCISYQLTNLVPNIYEMDDFQVRTPTDILGQHIHLVKFDVTSSDGGANGFNYEDGTFSPDETRERIHAINLGGGLNGVELHAEPHPVFGAGPSIPQSPGGAFLGAQTTVQRWYADPVQNNAGNDRTLRTVFTHDHFGPSTHQQTGLYAGLVVEPKGSRWRDPETGIYFGEGREDGGPTSWRADILTEDTDESYREFLLEYADFQLAYETGSQNGLTEGRGPTFPNEWECHTGSTDPCPGQQPGHGSGFGVAGLGFDNRDLAINPPSKREVFPKLLEKSPTCGEEPGAPAAPCPEAVSADDPGTFVVNYRNEPLALRTRDPSTGLQAVGDAGDLAMAFASIKRKDLDLNTQPTFYPPLTDNVGIYDPYTPLIQGFEHDRIQIRTLVGAHEEGHNLSVNGMKWLFEPSYKDSGFRNSQMQGLSEHFELEIPQLVKNPLGNAVDYLYAAGSATDDLWNGIWGLFRVFRSNSADLLRLPNNPNGGREVAPGQIGQFDGVCPNYAPKRGFKVTATTAQQLLGGPLTYNTREPLEDPTAIIYVRANDVDSSGRLKPGLEVEPLVLRANAGDCISVQLYNAIDKELGWPHDLDGWNTLPMIVEDYNNNDIHPSLKVGLHPQLVHYDVSRSDGNTVGRNKDQTIDPGQTITYQWYAGDVYVNDQGLVESTPIEFGATNLIPADRIKQPSKGAIGALIIEPQGATWTEDADLANCGQPDQPRCSRAAATIRTGYTDHFREFVLLFQDDLNLRCNSCGDYDADDPNATPNTAEAEDPEDSGQKGLNYRTEPMWLRLGFAPNKPLSQTKDEIFTNAVSNSQIGGDPETPIFYAKKGDKVRFRVLEPGGHARNHVFNVHGHVWQQEPYVSNASFPRGPVSIGDNPLSLWEGARMGHGPTNHFDAVLENGAGGAFGIEGDYLYRDQSSFLFDGGLWGLMRVQDYDDTVGPVIGPDPGEITPLP